MNLKPLIKITPSILLFVLAFNFLHSEIIDQFEGNSECQAQDYCTLVQAASVKISSSDLLKLKIDKPFRFRCIDEIKQPVKAFSILDSEQSHTPQKTTEVYLFNRTFLI
jgi:hypothetical protein